MELKNFKTIEDMSMVQMEVDKSRFIAVIASVEDVKDVKKFLASLKVSNKDAKHIAYAYRLGEDYVVAKYNDDGEPGGSAGLPIFEAIKRAELSNVVLAVVRYFGGKELGKSKLTRTYGAVANAVVKNTKIYEFKLCNIYEMKLTYHDYAILGKFLTEKGYYVLDQNTDESMPFIKVAIPQDIADKEVESIRARARGANFVNNVGTGFYKFRAQSK